MACNVGWSACHATPFQSLGRSHLLDKSSLNSKVRSTPLTSSGALFSIATTLLLLLRTAVWKSAAVFIKLVYIRYTDGVRKNLSNTFAVTSRAVWNTSGDTRGLIHMAWRRTLRFVVCTFCSTPGVTSVALRPLVRARRLSINQNPFGCNCEIGLLVALYSLATRQSFSRTANYKCGTSRAFVYLIRVFFWPAGFPFCISF